MHNRPPNESDVVPADLEHPHGREEAVEPVEPGDPGEPETKPGEPIENLPGEIEPQGGDMVADIEVDGLNVSVNPTSGVGALDRPNEVNWGDGSDPEYVDASNYPVTHTYVEAGTYTVTFDPLDDPDEVLPTEFEVVVSESEPEPEVEPGTLSGDSVSVVKPDSSWTKPMIVDWLEQHGITASEDELKADLLAKVEVV